jgi:addiction module HigA family antidote
MIMTIARQQLSSEDFRRVSTCRYLAPVHPGEVLLKDFIEPLEITRHKVSKLAGVQQRRIGEICAGQKSISGDTALRLARLFGTEAAFWINLQAQYDLEVSYRDMHERIEAEVTPLELAAWYLDQDRPVCRALFVDTRRARCGPWPAYRSYRAGNIAQSRKLPYCSG